MNKYLSSTNRRSFIKEISIAGTMLAAGPAILAQASDKKYKTALIGSGWWGNNILGEAMACGECKIVALCDVDNRYLDTTYDRVVKDAGDKPKKYRDYRELFAKEEVDIAIVATPDHWHPLRCAQCQRHWTAGHCGRVGAV